MPDTKWSFLLSAPSPAEGAVVCDRAARFVQAIPATWRVFSGTLEAPPGLEPEMESQIQIGNHGDRGISFSSHRERDDRQPGAAFQIIADRRNPWRVRFEVTDADSMANAKRFAAHYLQRGYRGRIQALSDYGTSLGARHSALHHESLQISIRPTWQTSLATWVEAGEIVTLAYMDEGECRGTEAGLAPFLALCTELGLAERRQT